MYVEAFNMLSAINLLSLQWKFMNVGMVSRLLWWEKGEHIAVYQKVQNMNTDHPP